MRIISILAFAAFPLGAMTTLSGTSPETSGPGVASASAGTLSGAVAVVRKLGLHIPTSDQQAWSDPPPRDQDDVRLAVGEVLPEWITLRSVPGHASYRYALVKGQRPIVDATSRQIVYIIR